MPTKMDTNHCWGGGTDDLINSRRRTSETKPAIIVLRKKEPETFLIVSPTGNRSSCDLFRTAGTNSVNRPFDIFAWKGEWNWPDSATTNADLQINASFDVTGNHWIVTYAVTNGAEGLILSDTVLYEAPETGYSPCTTFVMTNQHQTCYMYLKSRDPAVYSRIMFKHDFMTDDQSLWISGKVWTNPYGDRNLEYDERIDSAFVLADTLRKEALEAFAVGRYPEKPKDMGKLAEETRERVLREQEERNRRQKEWQAEQKKLKEAKNK